VTAEPADGPVRLTAAQTAALAGLTGGGGGGLTDDANALRLVDVHGTTIRRVTDMSAWWCWTGSTWTRDHDSAHVREAARTLARELPENNPKSRTHKRISLSSTGISSCVRVAESDPRISIRAADLDAHPLLLNTRSGVVDLRTGTVRPPDPRLLLTRLTATAVDLDAACPAWTAFLTDTFGGDGELAGYVQRLAGLALIGEVREHVLPFLHGVGANGKSVLLLVLQGLLGPADTGGYAIAAPDGFLMAARDGAHPTEIARLRGARLLVCSEQTSGRRFDEAKVKRLTGGDVLTGRFMRGDFFDFTPSHLTVIASNHLPQVREGGPSFWRRVRLIPFTHVVPEEHRDPDLAARILATEGPAVLGWAVRGAMAVLAGGLADPDRGALGRHDGCRHEGMERRWSSHSRVQRSGSVRAAGAGSSRTVRASSPRAVPASPASNDRWTGWWDRSSLSSRAAAKAASSAGSIAHSSATAAPMPHRTPNSAVAAEARVA